MTGLDVDVTVVRDLILDTLRAQQNWQVFNGSPDDADQPEVAVDADGRAHMYAVLWAGIGNPNRAEEAVCASPGPLVLSFQVTAAGGDQNRALRAAAKVRAALTGRHLTIPGGFPSGPMREQLDALTARADASVTPARWSVPMVYTIELS